MTCVCIENVEYNSCPAISCCVCSPIRFGTRRYIYVIIIILLHYYYYLPPPLKRLRHPITTIHYNIIPMLSCAHHRRRRRPLLCYIYPATTGRCICARIYASWSSADVILTRRSGATAHGKSVKLTGWQYFLPVIPTREQAIERACKREKN